MLVGAYEVPLPVAEKGTSMYRSSQNQELRKERERFWKLQGGAEGDSPKVAQVSNPVPEAQ